MFRAARWGGPLRAAASPPQSFLGEASEGAVEPPSDEVAAVTAFGLAIRNFVGPGEVPDVPALYAYAERAEALGFESLWAWDHVLLGVEPSFPILDSLTLLGAIAARTRQI